MSYSHAQRTRIHFTPQHWLLHFHFHQTRGGGGHRHTRQVYRTCRLNFWVNDLLVKNTTPPPGGGIMISRSSAGKSAASCRLRYHRAFGGARENKPRPRPTARARNCTGNPTRSSAFLTNPNLLHNSGSPRLRALGAHQRGGSSRRSPLCSYHTHASCSLPGAVSALFREPAIDWLALRARAWERFRPGARSRVETAAAGGRKGNPLWK